MKCDLQMQPECKILLKLQLVTCCCSLEMSYTLVSQQAIRKVVSSLLVTMYQIVRDTTNQYFKKKQQIFSPDNFCVPSSLQIYILCSNDLIHHIVLL